MDLVASSSSSIPTWKYDVFISFRGEDTRKTFTSHLHAALCREKIETYIDEEDLARGDEISPALKRAIEESMISVVVFSENYANSSWCLDELVYILKCKREYGRQVIPIFYNVDPSEVRNQRGSYAHAFAKRKKCFEHKLDSWRAALREAANLAGWDSQDTRTESKLVEVIVEDILKILNDLSQSCDNECLKGLFGIEKQIKQIESLLDFGTQEVRILGIRGMGGIGKTTLVRVLFNKFSPLFEGRFFLENVREKSKNGYGLRVLKVELFSELLNRKVHDPDSTFERNRVRRKKVLIVLDDVSHETQLRVLCGDRGDSFGPGSRVIVTTRDKRALILQVNDVYILDGLNRDDALGLFHWHAFKETSPTPDFNELSKQVVDYAGGNPLALEISGSFFRGREIEDWESLLKRLKGSSIEDGDHIQKILKNSYDGLRKDEKDAFLDIACFFKGMSKAFVERLLDVTIIKDLVDKSLVTIIEHNKDYYKEIHMHNLFQEMGCKVVRESTGGDLGKLSRIWNGEDAYSVLHNNTGTIKIEAIFLDWSNEGRWETQLDLPRDVFKKMYNLRLIKFSDKVYLSEGLDCLPNKLKYLEWHYYPLKSLPKNFNPCHFVVLVMSYSDEVEQLWDGVKDLHNLRHIDLSYCKNLIQLPDLSRASKLECVVLVECKSLKKFPQLPKKMIKFILSNANIEEVCSSSFDSLSSLSYLEITKCKRLESFPTKIYLKSLRIMDLSGCSKLKIFPEIEEPMGNLMELNLRRTAIKELPRSIENLVYLKVLLLDECVQLNLLPNTICKLYHLKGLSIVKCSKLTILPRLPPSVEVLNATGCISLEKVSAEKHWFVANYLRKLIYAQHKIAGLLAWNLWGDAIEMCWAGHKIPRWFSYQNKKSSLRMKLCLNSFDINFLGIAFCAVVDFNGSIPIGYYELCCQAHCDGTPDDVLFTWRYPCGSRTWELHGDQVFIRCDKSSREDFMRKLKEYKANRNCGCTSISINFNFSFEGSNCTHNQKLNLEVKKCGVYLLYAKEAQQLLVDLENPSPNFWMEKGTKELDTI
ncbi:hypothetical protein UlMin_033444 [Ulmus minor]